MTITLTPAVAAQVNTLMEKKLASAGEVVQLAVENLLSQEQSHAEKKAAFNEELDRRLASLDRGEGISQEDYRAHLDTKIAAWRQKCL